MSQTIELTAANVKYFAEICWSDINPFEVVRVVSDKTIEIREMHAEAGDWNPEWVDGGFAGVCTNQGQQKWNCSSNEAGKIVRIRLRKNGKWMSATGQVYKPTVRPVKFYDYNF